MEVSGIGVALLLLAIIGGGWIAESGAAETFTLSANQLTLALVVYGFVASVLPVWMLLAPRDYLSAFMKIGVIVLLAAAILLAWPTIQTEAVTEFAISGTGPVFAGSLFPFVFITIACGALSGFHSLICSGTTPKMIEKESQVRMIGYGAMLTESFVAIMALAAACVLDPGLYFAMNMPGTVLGPTVESASQAVAAIGFTITPDQLTAAAAAVEEESLHGRTGGAPTLAVGLAQIFSEVLGGEGFRAFWYHFAIMFEALFILTTVDAGTRVGRFMLQDTVGNLWPRFRDTSWKPAAWTASAVIVGLWGYLLYAGVNDPLGGIYQLFPLFGIANQLLATVALAVCTTLLIKAGRVRYAWITIVPLAFAAAVTLTASYQKIFSADPKLGFWAQRNQYQDALDAGQTSLGTAKSVEDMQQVVFNTTLDTALTALFAGLVVVVLVDAIRVWVAALSGRPLSSGAEDPYVRSQLWAPSGLIPTRQEREHQRELAQAGVSTEKR